MLPQSRNTTVRSARSSGGSVTAPSSAKKRYSCGSGNSSAAINITESLPSARSTPCIATSEPSASPSGCSWVTSTKRSSSRIRASTCSRAAASPRGVAHRDRRSREQLLDAQRAVGRLVVDELERRRALQAQLARDPAPAGSRGRCAGRRACPRAPAARLAAAAPSTLTYTRAWRRSGLVLTSVTVTNPTRGSFSSLRPRPRDLADRLVDPAHASRASS